MTPPSESHGAAHFDSLYATSEDPWNFRDSPYERAKYAATLAALPHRRWRAGLEVGCSIGELTRMLATRCDTLLGVDIAASPLVHARARCADQPHVQFLQMAVPGAWPAGDFDLIVLSEVLYFLSAADLATTAHRARDSLAGDGFVLLVNWLGQGDDPWDGDAAADYFIADTDVAWRVEKQVREPRFRIDLLKK
jgi:SAM-dependent methyltransferase